MKTTKYVFLGGRMVAGYAAKELVEHGLKPGELTIVSADSSVPYERPPLSKGFLAGKDSSESIRINSEDFYREHGIEIKLRCEIQSLDSTRKILYETSGQELAFQKLILATGARVRTLDIPGSGLAGIFYLRSLEDSARIRMQADTAKRVVVVGGGFIAMEVASVLAQKGLETTIILREDRIWKKFFTPAMSRSFEEYYSARGVRFIKQAKITELRGSSSVESAMVDSNQSLLCDMVVAGIGVRPVIEPFLNSGIELADGVLVNEYLETNHGDIYAAGDVASYQDTLFRKRRRVEHWDNAVSQGQHCARTLLGDRKPFEHVPYFFSDVFDLSYELWGDPADADETFERGDLSTSSFSVWWRRQGRIIAVFTMNRSDDERQAAQAWIASKERVSTETLLASRLGSSSQ